jgi:lipopolysaccharide biosynthesis protein
LLFDSFWKAINEFTIIKENILVFNHPSYNHFFNEWYKYKIDLKIDSSKELLKEIGTINSKNTIIKYKK